MFARMTGLHFLPHNAEQGFGILQDAIVPTNKEEAGFKGLVLLRDLATWSATAVTLWESEADMQASASGNYPIQLAKVSQLLSGQPTRRIYVIKEISL
jgi:hypothetical protein